MRPPHFRRSSSTSFLVIVILLGLTIDGLTRHHPLTSRLDADDGARVFETAEHRIRVITMVSGLERAWSLAFLPGGDLLLTERPGRLRLVRKGVLDAHPIDGVPAVHATEHGGLLEVVLHPRFDQNGWLYLTYTKSGAKGVTVALARARFTGRALRDVHDIFVADAWHQRNVLFGGKLAFSPDGHLFMALGDGDERHRAQSLADHAGTVVRLRDDGRVPPDNPFVGRPGVRPEIYSYGHRNPQGLAFDPTTGDLWEHEHGPQGGDELNRLVPGGNYGWPTVTYGREYTGGTISDRPWREGMEQPIIFWAPSIGISGMTFYTGNRFPAWKTGLFVGALAAHQLQRLAFSDQGPVQREPMLMPLGQRIRDVRQGPDELLYVVTDGDDGSVLRIEPVVSPS